MLQKPVTICLTDQQRNALARLAKKTGKSQSAIVRVALDRFLATTKNQRTRWAIQQLAGGVSTAPNGGETGESPAVVGSHTDDTAGIIGGTICDGISTQDVSYEPFW